MTGEATATEIDVDALLDLLSRSADGVFAVDIDQRIVYWGERMVEMTGIEAGDVVGQHCYEVLRGRTRANRELCSSECPVHRVGRTHGRPESFEMVRPGSDGASVLSVSVIPSGQLEPGRPLLVHLVRDLTGKEREGRLQRSGVPQSALVEAQAFGDGAKLRPRELEVLRLIADGYTTSGLSLKLGITVVTVHNHIQRILKKLDVHTRREAVREGVRRGIL